MANLHGNDPNQGRGGMQGDACSERVLESRLLASAAPRVWHTGEGKAQVLGKLLLGVHRKPVACRFHPYACGFACACGSVLIPSHPLLHAERAGSKPLILTLSPRSRLGRKLELLTRAMALPSVRGVMWVAIPLISVLGLLSGRLVGASQDSGSVIPAESRPCVDCHAFEFMQRALQDLKKTAYNLDTRTESLLLRAEKRGLCDCFPAIL
uniref:NELL2-interacting cell ontogeny regulator 1 n=2 Tax=Anserinae TaxID=2068722 RepID=A0A8B9IFT6_ANSCY